MSEKSAREFIESRLTPPLLHGDEKHQAWLRDELRKWIPELAATINAELRLRDYTCHVCWTNSYTPCEKDTPGSLGDLKRPGQYVVCELCSMTEALRQKQFECDYILDQMCDARDYWKRRAEASWEREDQSGGTLFSLENQLRKAREVLQRVSVDTSVPHLGIYPSCDPGCLKCAAMAALVPQEDISLAATQEGRCSLCGAPRIRLTMPNAVPAAWGACTFVECRDPLKDYRAENIRDSVSEQC